MTVPPANYQKSRNVSMAEMELQFCTNNGEWQDARETAESYIRMVQHLIEKCLLLGMGCNGCVNALSKHANINPIVTRTDLCELAVSEREVNHLEHVSSLLSPTDVKEYAISLPVCKRCTATGKIRGRRPRCDWAPISRQSTK